MVSFWIGREDGKIYYVLFETITFYTLIHHMIMTEVRFVTLIISNNIRIDYIFHPQKYI